MPRPSSSSSGFDDDIVERRLGDPLATALMAVCALCLTGAIALQVWECFAYRGAERDTLENAASDHKRKLVERVTPLWTAFSQTATRALDRVPQKGTLEGTTFVPEDPTAFQGLDVQALVARLCTEYGYGDVVYRPALQAMGVESTAPVPAADEGAGIDEAVAREIIGTEPVEPSDPPDVLEAPDSWLDDTRSEVEEPASEPVQPADDPWGEPEEPAGDQPEEPADDAWDEPEDMES